MSKIIVDSIQTNGATTMWPTNAYLTYKGTGIPEFLEQRGLSSHTDNSSGNYSFTMSPFMANVNYAIQSRGQHYIPSNATYRGMSADYCPGPDKDRSTSTFRQQNYDVSLRDSPMFCTNIFEP
jgi:hypothetical protein